MKTYVKIIGGKHQGSYAEIIHSREYYSKVKTIPDNTLALVLTCFVKPLNCPVQINAIKLLYEKENNAK